MKFRDEKDMPVSATANYLKLRGGEKVHGIFRGDIHEFWSVWENGKQKEVPENTQGAGFRFRVNFVVKEGATFVPKVFEQGVTFYKQLAELNETWPLETTIVQISRQGNSMNDTTYTITPLKQELKPETIKHLETLELNDLTGKKKSQGNDAPWPEAPPQGFDQHDEIPF